MKRDLCEINSHVGKVSCLLGLKHFSTQQLIKYLAQNSDSTGSESQTSNPCNVPLGSRNMLMTQKKKKKYCKD